ncbi:hypothetical protein E8D34_09735 [Nocardioides sp. GY 10113]|uniref:glycosyltransferase family 2 protein n=1 Tax=Nocardioides sp. GY 10113 TaxID=2569761 RepID=UPI0010A7ECA8|nr:glycosyltransferase family 2 protein [Nocardioides sp. GY 10113]TIC87403.1 hypothetical protein E8D34_09735 [Nocardioides sp. GY 10113]
MLITASTIKDEAANVRFFVEANLASGVDHLVVFLDAPRAPGQPEVADYLEQHPQVTCVRAGGPGWWLGERPASLNTRQEINANWAHQLLAPLGADAWLVHIDGDEVALMDRDALAAVPADVEVLRLATLEALARTGATERSTQFKRLLDDDELNLLQVLGVIDEATNQAYFHGHVMGKSAIRVSSPLSFSLHDAISADGARHAGHEHDGFRVLHYDAPTETEFIRKWAALASAGPARYRASRQPSARALKSLVTSDLPEQVREKYLRRIYALTIADDVEALGDLGLLVEHDPLRGTAATGGLTDEQRRTLAERAALLREEPKAAFQAPAREGRTRPDGEPRASRLFRRG